MFLLIVVFALNSAFHAWRHGWLVVNKLSIISLLFSVFYTFFSLYNPKFPSSLFLLLLRPHKAFDKKMTAPRTIINKLGMISDKCHQAAWQLKDPSNLAVTRILFGFLMAVDIHFERGFAEVDHRFGGFTQCHFPLFDFVKPLTFQWMCLVYLLMWLGACGIMVGYNFKLSCLSFVIPYWYILILDKTSWNNHSYLYGLLSILLLFSSANHYCSIDAWINPDIRNKPVLNWNYLLVKFQIFLLYFYAGVKKMDPEWLGGYSMKNLGSHWVFTPFKIFLTEETIEYYMVHIGGFVLDLTVGVWLLWPKSRPLALFFATSFHMMNAQLFTIGMFPYVCLATLPVFCDDDWPKRWIAKCRGLLRRCLPDATKIATTTTRENGGKYSAFKITLMGLYVVTQLVLPWSHSVTQGYNNWTNGLYGYSWDMMVHAWETMHVVVTVKDKTTGRLNYLDTEVFVRNDKWVGHADMVYQYAHCVKDRLEAVNMTDVAIYVDVWRSLNGRFQQRLIDPRVNLLEAEWSPFRPTPWLMPLLTELSAWRQKLTQLERTVFNWSDSSRVAFVADFPGLSMDNYVPEGVTNATIQVLEGQVELSIENGTRSYLLNANDTASLPSRVMHKITTTSTVPACYMYTFIGPATASESGNARRNNAKKETSHRDVSLMTPFAKSLALVGQSILNLVFGIPLVMHNSK
ncbi:Gamma-glutamyl carboxylase [Daphnia magna]|uniref:Vitamin K-dependent gamma-carboxylase n=1 Tax=Daphnia magna TaxID=35525 RepID=A0A164QCT5_9CRUS|nr:Gamma-glutamyl carboxylase [Daphnia magna]